MLPVLKIVLSIIHILAALLGLAYAYRSIYVILGFFRTRIFPKTQKFHRYAIVIAARNEEKVIGHLLESISLQNYPGELLSVFVVADQCSDATATVARQHGAVCYERNNVSPKQRTKGYALKFLFDHIHADYGKDAFEGFIVFDADNLLSPDFVARMNDAFDAGARLVASCRNTKNFNENWIAYSYGIHWFNTVRCEHRARSFLGLSTRLQGTGYLFDADLVRDGWHFTSLTEDRELTAAAVCRGYRISYQDAAMFYDEQPTSLRIALRQRMRWAKGNLLVFRRLGTMLIREQWHRLLRPSPNEKRLSGSFVCFDIFMTILPESLLIVFKKIFTFALELSIFLLSGVTQSTANAFLLTLALNIGKDYLTRLVIPIYVLVTERKRLPPISTSLKWAGSLLWPIFPLIGEVTMGLAAFLPVEWKPIPHDAALSIDDLQPPQSSNENVS